ncbi:MAG: RNA polymerase sigma factor [Mangrovibacterium sp.]
MTDKEYILALQQNDERASSRLYDKYRAKFFGTIRKYAPKNEDYLSELYQESYIVLWENVSCGKLTPENLTSSLSTYLIAIGKFKLMAKNRKDEKFSHEDFMEKYAPLLSDEQDSEQTERNALVQSVVDKLGEPCSTLLDKFYWESLSGNDIAIQLNYKNADSVKTQKSKCMSKLKLTIRKTELN